MYVYDFADGNRGLADLLGGKGANLAEMTRLGLPVPPGFTISTDACRDFLRTGRLPEGLLTEVREHLRRVERAIGRRLDDPNDPLLLSCRSGARFSMPGMMETILDIGLNDDSVAGLAARSGDERFAWDSYRRLIQMFGRTACDVPAEEFEQALAAHRRAAGVARDADLSAAGLRHLVEDYQKIFHHHTGFDFPQEPLRQLELAIEAVFRSWNTERARVYRRREHIADDLGTAVNIMAMVFGNRGEDSGTGVAFTRDPATGAAGVYGDYLTNAQGEDVVAGIRDAVPLADLERLNPRCFAELLGHLRTLEEHYRDLCDVEFTIERGTLWLLQTRVGKRTPAAAFVIAAQLVDEGMITLDDALRRVTGAQLVHLMFPRFDLAAAPAPLATGVPASPGAATGRAVFDAHRAATFSGPVILVRRETNPDDLPGMVAAEGILTSRGGKTSHAAVVARGMGKVCVCGAESLDVGPDSFTVFTAGMAGPVTVHEGDLLSIDGSSGAIYVGAVPVEPSPVVRYFEGTLQPTADPLVAAVDRLMTRADEVRRLGVLANADSGPDAARARRFGAAGIGLCRTEHMFLGERRHIVERLILASTGHDEAALQEALADLLPLQRADFVEILTAMDGLPVVIRLLDPPLHEFLPSLSSLTELVASGQASPREVTLLDAVRRLHEQNPMLGLRGVRLGLAVPGLYAMQVRAIALAAADCAARGLTPRPEVMIPLVATATELVITRAEAAGILAEHGLTDVPIGTMIEIPRAALTAGTIAESADFFSFGTNDLTQLTWGFSRDDVEGSFLPAYLTRGIVGVSPFETLDPLGVGELVRIAVARGRAANPHLVIGVCGEHGGDPESVRFFAAANLDYVSCSPYRVPVARLESARATL